MISKLKEYDDRRILKKIMELYIELLEKIKFHLNSFEDKISFCLSCKFHYAVLGKGIRNNLSVDQENALGYLKLQDHNSAVCMNPSSGKTVVCILFLEFLLSKGKNAYIFALNKEMNYRRSLEKLGISLELQILHTSREIRSKNLEEDCIIILDASRVTTPERKRRFDQDVFQITNKSKSSSFYTIFSSDYIFRKDSLFFCKYHPLDNGYETTFRVVSSKRKEIFSYDPEKTLSKSEIACQILEEWSYIEPSKVLVAHSLESLSDTSSIFLFCKDKQIEFAEPAFCEAELSSKTKLLFIPSKNKSKSEKGKTSVAAQFRNLLDRARRRTFDLKKLEVIILVDSCSSEEMSLVYSLLLSRKRKMKLTRKNSSCSLMLSKNPPKIKEGENFSIKEACFFAYRHRNLCYNKISKDKFLPTSETCFANQNGKNTAIQRKKNKRPPEPIKDERPSKKAKISESIPEDFEKQNEILRNLLMEQSLIENFECTINAYPSFEEDNLFLMEEFW